MLLYVRSKSFVQIGLLDSSLCSISLRFYAKDALLTFLLISSMHLVFFHLIRNRHKLYQFLVFILLAIFMILKTIMQN